MSGTTHRTTRATAALATTLTLCLVLPPAAGAAGASEVVPGPGDPDTLRTVLVTAADRASADRAGAEASQDDRSVATPGTKAPRRPGPVAAPGLNAALQTLVDDGAVGVSARVASPGGLWNGAAGVREEGGTQAARAQDRFRVASITKAMVATLVLQEVEAGTLALDTPVEQVLPGVFPDQPDVTVEHLLSHLSGAPTGSDSLLAARMSDPTSVDQLFEAMGQDYTDADHVAAALATPWVAEPGTAFSYSNSGYVVLGMVLEATTGRSVESLLAERVFAPAGMKHTLYPDEPTTAGRFLTEAAWLGESEGGWRSLAGFDPDVFSHAGAVVSTTADLNSFTAALVGGELLTQESVQDMLTPRSGTMEYGLGAYRIPDPCALPGQEDPYLYGHDGATFGTLSIAFTSADGERQVSLGVSGRNLSADPEALYALEDALVPLLLATCP